MSQQFAPPDYAAERARRDARIKASEAELARQFAWAHRDDPVAPDGRAELVSMTQQVMIQNPSMSPAAARSQAQRIISVGAMDAVMLDFEQAQARAETQNALDAEAAAATRVAFHERADAEAAFEASKSPEQRREETFQKSLVDLGMRPSDDQ